MNFKKISVQLLIAVSVISTGLVSCDNEPDQTFNANGRQLTEKSNNSFQQVQSVAKELGDSVVEDPNIDPENAMSFDNIEDYRAFVKAQDAYLDGVINQELIPHVIKTYGDCADGLYTGSIGAGFGTLYFDVAVSHGAITVTSRYGGFHLGTSWTQGGYGVKGNVITCTGTFNYDIFFEGIGTIYSHAVSFTITLPC